MNGVFLLGGGGGRGETGGAGGWTEGGRGRGIVYQLVKMLILYVHFLLE